MAPQMVARLLKKNLLVYLASNRELLSKRRQLIEKRIVVALAEMLTCTFEKFAFTHERMS